MGSKERNYLFHLRVGRGENTWSEKKYVSKYILHIYINNFGELFFDIGSDQP